MSNYSYIHKEVGGKSFRSSTSVRISLIVCKKFRIFVEDTRPRYHLRGKSSIKVE